MSKNTWYQNWKFLVDTSIDIDFVLVKVDEKYFKKSYFTGSCRCMWTWYLKSATFRGHTRCGREARRYVYRSRRVRARHARMGHFRASSKSTFHCCRQNPENFPVNKRQIAGGPSTYGGDIMFPSLRLVFGCFCMMSSCPSKVFRYWICWGEGTGMRFGSLTPAVGTVVVQELADVLNCCFCCAIDCKVRPNRPSKKKKDK